MNFGYELDHCTICGQPIDEDTASTDEDAINDGACNECFEESWTSTFDEGAASAFYFASALTQSIASSRE